MTDCLPESQWVTVWNGAVDPPPQPAPKVRRQERRRIIESPERDRLVPRMRELRDDGMGCREIARMTGVSQSTVSRYLNGDGRSR